MFPRYRNRKNQEIYLRLGEVRDCTNARDGVTQVLYCREDNRRQLFVREAGEFAEKFEPLPAQEAAVSRAPSPERVNEIVEMMSELGLYTQAEEVLRLSLEEVRLRQCLQLNAPEADLRPVDVGHAVLHPLYPHEQEACEAAFQRARQRDPEAAERLRSLLPAILTTAIQTAIAAGLPPIGPRVASTTAAKKASA